MQKLTYKNKLILLVLGCLILGILVYSLAIKETLDLKNKFCFYQTQLQQIETAPKEIAKIQSKIERFNETMGKAMDTTYRNEPLMEFLSHVCRKNQVVLADYLAPHRSEQENFLIETRTAIVEGKFINLLVTLYEIEQNFNWGKTSSASFAIKEDFRSNKRNLFLTIYIQSVINKNTQTSLNKS